MFMKTTILISYPELMAVAKKVLNARILTISKSFYDMTVNNRDMFKIVYDGDECIQCSSCDFYISEDTIDRCTLIRNPEQIPNPKNGNWIRQELCKNVTNYILNRTEN